MKRFFGLALSSLAIAALSTASLAQTTITVSTWGGPNHGINSIVWPTWKAWIEEATDNRVTLEVVHDLGPPDAQMAMIADGVADATWIFHGHMPGRFRFTRLPEFPTFEAFSSETASAAYWTTFEKYLAPAVEHKGLEVIAVGVHGPGQIFTTEPVKTFAQLDGMRLRVGGGVMSDLANAIGVTGVALPPTSVYEATSQGVIDGAMLTLEGLRSFRVAEVAPHVLTVDGGFYRGSFAIIMNSDVWERMSAEDREAIEAISGGPASRLFGYMMDVVDEGGVEFAKGMGSTFIQASEEDVAMLKKVTETLVDQWIDEVGGSEVDAQEALNFYRKQLDVAAERESIASRLEQQ